MHTREILLVAKRNDPGQHHTIRAFGVSFTHQASSTSDLTLSSFIPSYRCQRPSKCRAQGSMDGRWPRGRGRAVPRTLDGIKSTASRSQRFEDGPSFSSILYRYDSSQGWCCIKPSLLCSSSALQRQHISNMRQNT
jgi:hypothetical protein